MQGDGPTLSNLPAYTPGASSGEPEGTPPWPSRREGGQHAFDDERLPFGSAYPIILGISFFANVVLVLALIGVLLATHTGFFSPRNSSPGVAAPSLTASTPTATANLTPSTGGGWLQVTPNTVHLTCDGGQRSQFVVLANTGPERVQWQADFPGSTDQAPVTVSPNQGELRAGANVAIQIQINTHSDGSQGSAGQQGVIHFDPDTPDAGAPPSLSYTTDACNN